MAFVSSILGGGSGSSNAQAAPIVNPASQAQADTQYNNAQAALAQQQAFANAVSGQNGLGNQANVFAQQQALANQLGQQSMGHGPNPAQAQLAQNTAANVAQQSALMAGQRGSSSNAGLIARQIGNQGANIQQQAVGQSATLQAQQQLAAQQALMQQQAAMQGVAGAQVGQQAGAIGGYNQAAQGEQSNILNALNQQNSANVGMQSNINNANAQAQAAQSQMQGTITGGLLQGGATLGAAALGKGKAHGGMIDAPPMTGSFFSQAQMAYGGPVLAASGGTVGGEAKVAGDSGKNDTVPTMLSPGEIVIPRSVALHPNAPQEAAKFVAAVLARGGRR